MKARTKKILWITGITALTVAAVGFLFVKDQIGRQRRNLFSPVALKRMAALEHIARQGASSDQINLLRDYIAWEPRQLLRNRARAIVDRMAVGPGGLGEPAS